MAVAATDRVRKASMFRGPRHLLNRWICSQSQERVDCCNAWPPRQCSGAWVRSQLPLGNLGRGTGKAVCEFSVIMHR
jgi:hypothetical protein